MEDKRQTLRLGIIILFIYLIISSSREIVSLWQAQEKITSREKALMALRKEREELLKKTAEVSSEEYVERVARDKLGLAKQGEETIVIAPELLVDKVEGNPEGTEANWEKWWRLLF